MRIILLRSNEISYDSRVQKEAKALLELGHDVMILGWDRSRHFKEQRIALKYKEKGLPVTLLGIKSTFGSGIKNIGKWALFQLRLLKWLTIHRAEYDTMHACDFDTAFTACLITKLFNKKLVYDIFDYYVHAFGVPTLLKPLVEAIDTWVINQADSLIITNESCLEQIKKASPKKLSIIYNSPEEVEILEKGRYTSGQKLKFAYIGVLPPNRLLREIAECIAVNKDWELYIGGFGPLEKDLISLSETHENIKFLGKLPYEEVLQLEYECDILFAVNNPEILNYKYTSPNKLHEALMLGKPIIVAKGTGAGRFVADNAIGEVINYDKNSFQKAGSRLQQCLKDEGFKEYLKKRAQDLFETQFCWKLMKERLAKLYDEL